MGKFDKVPTRKKVFKARHLEPGDFALNYILLPIGYGYNTEWISAKKGDSIRLHDGGTYKILCVRSVKVRGGLAELLSRVRYGISIAGCMQRWRDNAKLEGHSRDVISDSECLWVIYEKDEQRQPISD